MWNIFCKSMIFIKYKINDFNSFIFYFLYKNIKYFLIVGFFGELA